MKPNIKKIPVALTTIALVGQLSLPAAALVVVQPRTLDGDVNITEVFRDQKLQAWLLDRSNLNGIGEDGILTEVERQTVTELNLSGLGLEGRPITLVVNIENTAKSAAANHVAQQLESAGLVVTVERLPWAEYLETVAAGDFDLYMGEVYLTPDFDLTPLIGLGGGLNFGGWTSSVAGGLLSAFRSAQADSRAAAASALCRHLCQQVPIAPICFRSGTMLAQYGRVENAAPVYGNLFAGLENWEIS